jgi:hypothetical protein
MGPKTAYTKKNNRNGTMNATHRDASIKKSCNPSMFNLFIDFQASPIFFLMCANGLAKLRLLRP